METRAKEYAEGKFTEIVNKLIEDAYKAGYREGFSDGENNKAIMIQNYDDDDEIFKALGLSVKSSDIEYVDLGLPSGTLWASDYLKDDDDVYLPYGYVYLPYVDASTLNIPTLEQKEELIKLCHLEIRYNSITVIGPNGNFISFNNVGYRKANVPQKDEQGYFWIHNDGQCAANSCKLRFKDDPYHCPIESDVNFTGICLPIRLVKTK